MKAFVISDNVDTYMGMRLAGFDGVVVHQKEEVLDALQQCLTDDSLACVLMTTKIVEMIPDVISEYKLHCCVKFPIVMAIAKLVKRLMRTSVKRLALNFS